MNCTSQLRQIFVHIARDRGSVPLWWLYITLYTSGFTDDVMFAQLAVRRRDATATVSLQGVYGLTPLLRGIGCVQSCAKTRRVVHARGAGAEFAIHRCLVTLHDITTTEREVRQTADKHSSYAKRLKLKTV